MRLERVVNCIRPWCALQLQDATEIEMNAFDPKGHVRIHRAVVLTSRGRQLSTTDELAGLMIHRGVLPGDFIECRALQGELVIARLGLGFLESATADRLEVERGAGSITARLWATTPTYPAQHLPDCLCAPLSARFYRLALNGGLLTSEIRGVKLPASNRKRRNDYA
jgi:hypothetical protein